MLFSALPPACWASPGTSASLPAAWGQHYCSAPWDQLESSTASALDLFHLLLMMTPKDWKEAASASLVGQWHTGELSLFSSIRCPRPKPCPLPGRSQGRGAGGCERGASVSRCWCTWDSILSVVQGFLQEKPEGFIMPVVHFIWKVCPYCLKNWVELTCSRDVFIFACKTSQLLCHGHSIAFSQIVCNSAFKMIWWCKLSNYQDLNSKTQRFQVIGLMSFIYFNSCQLIINLIRECRLKSKPGSVIILGTHMWIKGLFIYTVWESGAEIYIVSLSIIQICKIIFRWVGEAMEITNNISCIRSNLVCNSLWSDQIILLYLTKIAL